MMKPFLTLFVLLPLLATAQMQKNNWYFGIGAAISFSNGSPTVKYDNPLKTYSTVSASISHHQTGDLVFYTNGHEVRNADHTVCKNGDDIGHNNPLDVLILDDPFKKDEYYLFVLNHFGATPTSPQLAYHKVVKNDQGQFTVLPETILKNGNIQKITAVRNCSNGGYWLLYHQSKDDPGFYAHAIGRGGVDTEPVFSPNTTAHPLSSIGDIVSNHNGNQIAISEFNAGGSAVLLIDFDKQCGQFTFNRAIVTNSSEREYAFGLAYSPNNQFIYITYSVGRSELWQYSVATGSGSRFFLSDYNMNELQVGPDNKIYISTHDNGIPGPRINVIHKPNEMGVANAEHEENYLNLGSGRTSNFHFPNFIQDYAQKSCQDQFPKFDNLLICEGANGQIYAANDFQPQEDYHWEFQGNVFNDLEPTLEMKEPGIDTAWFYYETCTEVDSIPVQVWARYRPEIALANDTSFCEGDSIILELPILRATYNWSPPISRNHRAVIKEAGTYTVTVDNGCVSTDSISVKSFPGIWVDLGEGYFLCEDHNELVRLDAGKGFEKYRWFPTDDTTQWIEVSRTDSYFVVGEDFRGCKGDGDALVERRCPFYIYFPNAFSPNNDGINEHFAPIGQDLISMELEIYNRWGECIFTSTSAAKPWDGTFNGANCPAGQYLYRCHYRGLKPNYKPIDRYVSGRVMLIR